jgi:RNA polymerase sigma factor for flagellar operon FliA
MPERPDLAALLVQHLAYIDKVAARLSRRHGGDDDDAQEFGAWAKARLIENDYAILSKFRGESAVTTYLTVVLTMLHRDYRVEQWGRWRSSAAAQREGSVALRLEQLVKRDGYTLQQAAQVLRSRGETDLSDIDLARLLGRLPEGHRGRPDQVGEDSLAAASSADRADAAVLRAEDDAERGWLNDAIHGLMESLDEEDAVILRMRFWKNESIADIARALRLEQKPLYRRVDRLLAKLRTELERRGVSAESLRALAEHRDEEG